MSNRTPTWPEVIALAVEKGLARTHVALPAKIEKFDPVTQLAAVKPYLMESFDNEDGTEGTEELHVINNVPVQFPGCGGFIYTAPVAVGDPCWLVFSDRSLDVWKTKGGIVDPVDLRRHHLSDAVALLGVRSRAGALAEFDTNAMRLGKVGGVGIRIKSAEVHLGVGHNEDATNFVALANLVKSELDQIYTYLNTHVHATPAGPSTTVTLAPPKTSSTPVAAANVKAK